MKEAIQIAILVIGNGFDLAHGLQTSYADFLEFHNLYVATAEELQNAERRNPELTHFVNNLKTVDNDLNREVHNLLAHINVLLTHFHVAYEGQQLNGNKWVDFESEIDRIVQLFENARMEEKSGNQLLSEKLTKALYPFLTAGHDEVYPLKQIHIVPALFEEQARRRLDDLNIITRLIEIYLAAFVDKLHYVDPIQQIAELPNITHVLSFNYTHTYQRLYGKPDTKYCYIHGEAKEKSSIDRCNLVLGINEFLQDDARDKDNAFIWFKKFYQRIYKETDSSYIDWLERHENSRKVYRNYSSGIPVLDIYFYGHSLDVTDKDVLKKLLLHENARSHIFYRNKDSMARQIQNLVKIIGEENLIRMTRGSNRSIIFEPMRHEG